MRKVYMGQTDVFFAGKGGDRRGQGGAWVRGAGVKGGEKAGVKGSEEA